jgi:hypothetical protein
MVELSKIHFMSYSIIALLKHFLRHSWRMIIAHIGNTLPAKARAYSGKEGIVGWNMGQ